MATPRIEPGARQPVRFRLRARHPHISFTNSAARTDEVALHAFDQLDDLRNLRQGFHEPDAPKDGATAEAVTKVPPTESTAIENANDRRR